MITLPASERVRKIQEDDIKLHEKKCFVFSVVDLEYKIERYIKQELKLE